MKTETIQSLISNFESYVKQTESSVDLTSRNANV